MATLDSLVILSAAPFEAIPLLDGLKALDQPFEYMSFGIGSIASAWCAQKLAEQCQNKNVVVLGSAGCFGPFKSPYLVKTKSIYWKPRCVSERMCELIEGTDLPWDSRGKTLLSSDLPNVHVHCTPGISVTSPTLLDPHIVENLEFYSLKPVFEASQTFDSFLVITNAVGPLGRSQWKENFKEGADLTGKILLQEFKENL